MQRKADGRVEGREGKGGVERKGGSGRGEGRVASWLLGDGRPCLKFWTLCNFDPPLAA